MSIRDRALDAIGGITGMRLIEEQELETLQESREQLDVLRHEAEDLAFHSLNMAGTVDLRENAVRRHTRLLRARRAWERDPIAGTEAEHYANFSVGRGVSHPQARDEDVQKVIDDAWSDAINASRLTGYEALRAISNELRVSANLFPVAYVLNGKVRVDFLHEELVEDIIAHENDDDLPLWYVVRDVKRHYDFGSRTWTVAGNVEDVRYIPHWRNLELARKNPAMKDGVPEPPEDRVAKDGEGLAHHIRANRLIHDRYGTPFWARTLRYYSALSRLLEARVEMAQAASSIIAKRVQSGGNRDVERAAENVLRRTGEVAASRAARNAATTSPDGTPRPPRAAINVENEASRLEAFSLNSGAGNAELDVRMIRGAATAPSGMGQHYFGDAGDASMATASTIELPALMAVGAHQELIEGLLRWFTDLVIQEAVRSGRLGGRASKGRRKLADLNLQESADLEEAEDRTGKDLSYSFSMPYPGRRNLPEVVSAVTSVLTQLSPIGENPILTETVLNFLFTHGFQLEDASRIAKEVNEKQQELIKRQSEQAPTPPPGGDAPVPPELPPGEDADTGKGEPADDESVYGERRRSASADAAQETETLPPEVEAELERLLADLDEMYDQGVIIPAIAAASALNGSAAP